MIRKVSFEELKKIYFGRLRNNHCQSIEQANEFLKKNKKELKKCWLSHGKIMDFGKDELE
jgi:predicted methyltransferase MtxX (methanogen marker protein 4)